MSFHGPLPGPQRLLGPACVALCPFWVGLVKSRGLKRHVACRRLDPP